MNRTLRRLLLSATLWLGTAAAALAQNQAVVPPNVAATPIVSTSLEGSHVLKASKGNLYSLYVYNAGSAAFLMTFNATSLPANGAVTPIQCIPVAAANYQYINFAPTPPEYYSTGIVAAISTGANCLTLTVGSGAFFHAVVQ